MKKAHLLLVLGILIAAQATAQEDILRKKYTNLSFSNIEMTQEDSPTLKSNYGAAFTVGRTFFVHKKPIARMIRFGIDATWFDINYINYNVEYRYQDERGQSGYESDLISFHQAEIGMQIGPSITINPVSKLNVHSYIRYAPSFSALYDGNSFRGGYAGFLVGGGAVSYGVIGLGVEARFGGCNYKTFGGGDEDFGFEEEETYVTPQSKFSGMRVYLTFRF